MAVRTTQRQSDVGLRIRLAHTGRDGLGHRQRQSKIVGLIRAIVVRALGPHDGLNASAQQVLAGRIGIADLASTDERSSAIGQAELHTIAVHRQRESAVDPGG